MKTITIVTGWSFPTRNLLRTDVLKTLKSDKNLRIVILSPAVWEGYFIKEFADDNVVIEKLYRFNNKYNYEYGTLELLFRGLRGTVLMHPKFSATSYIKSTIFNRKHPFLGAFRTILLKTLFRSKSFRILLEKLEIVIFPDKYHKKIFQKYNPSLVLVAFPFYNVYPVVRRAVRNKVPIIAHISSWDNLTSRGELPFKFDKLIVWNNTMKEEAIKYHGYHPDDVWVCGAPQFDIYFGGRLPPKEEFFKKMGADPTKKLIVYCMGSPGTKYVDNDIIDILNKSIEKGKIAYPCQLIIRQSPKSVRKPAETIRKSNIVMEIGRPVPFFPDYKVDILSEHMIDFACLLKYCDLLISTASTTTIDASCFDTPVINIGFDGYKKKPYWSSVLRFYDYTHYSELGKLGGSWVVKSEDELIQAINEYLRNPELHKEGRRKIVETQCQYTDGKSGERIAKMILSYLRSLSR